MEKIYKIGEIAEILQISKSCVYKMVERGHISSLKIGSAVRIRERQLKDYLDRSKNTSAKEKKGKNNNKG